MNELASFETAVLKSLFSAVLKLKILKWKWKSIQVGPIKKIQFGGYALFLGSTAMLPLHPFWNMSIF